MNFPKEWTRYRDLRPLSESEVSRSFSGLDPKGLRVFFKVLRSDRRYSEFASYSFRREMAIRRQIAGDSSGVPAPRLIETGEIYGLPYIADEFLEGRTLAEFMRLCPVSEPESVFAFFCKLLEALRLMHEAGIIHGDISPENIFLERTGLPPTSELPLSGFGIRLLDFGSARTLAGPQSSSFPGKILVKPSYAAPELAEGRPTSAQSDLFSCGVVLFEMLEGHPPWEVHHLEDVPASVRRGIPFPGHPSNILIGSLVSMDPAKRPRSAAEYLDLFARGDTSVHALRHRTAGTSPSTYDVRTEESTLEASPPLLGSARHSNLDRFRLLLASVRGRMPRRSRKRLKPPWKHVPTPTRPEEARRDVASMAADVPIRDETQNLRPLDISVFAPVAVAPGTRFVLEVWAYSRSQRHLVLSLARREGRMLERGSRGPVRVGSGKPIVLLLDIPGFEVAEKHDSFFWSEDFTNVPFIVGAPENLGPGLHPGQVKVIQNGLMLSRIVFDLVVAERPHPVAHSLPIRAEKVRTAFASYASTDRPEVLARVQGIQAAGVDVFLDVLTLRSGQRWESLVRENIVARDIFYLFWSAAARASKWVEKEWRIAVSERGLECIHPVPLVDPRDVPPPSELMSLHFNDAFLAFLKAERKARENT